MPTLTGAAPLPTVALPPQCATLRRSSASSERGPCCVSLHICVKSPGYRKITDLGDIPETVERGYKSGDNGDLLVVAAKKFEADTQNRVRFFR